MKIIHLHLVGLIVLVLAAGAAAQNAPPPEQSHSPRATIVPAPEIRDAVERNASEAVSDAVLRVLPIDGRHNVGVSVVSRSQVDGKTPPDAIVHDAMTEVYQIIEGEGVLVTGGTIESAEALAADDPGVRQQFGPSFEGKVIRDGTRRQVGPGDIVVIPPRTPHGFEEITIKRIVYTLIRIDPQRLLELHDQPL